MTKTEKAAFIEELFCSSCEFAANRRDKKCPKGQSTCGSKIAAIYTLKRDYVGLTEGVEVAVKDIFWSVSGDYATVTVITSQRNRFGVPYSILEKTDRNRDTHWT